MLFLYFVCMAIVAFCVKQVTPNNWLLAAVIVGLGAVGYLVGAIAGEIIAVVRAEGTDTRNNTSLMISPMEDEES